MRRFHYIDSLENVEDLDNYCPGGFHPIHIGDSFAQGRYKVLHKLGFGGSSTVWLARDHHQGGRLVALKALRADKSDSSNYELGIQENLQAADPPIPNIQIVDDYFYVDGPNGTHLFLVTNRWDQRKVIKQLVSAVDGLHHAGVVHGDITCHNILFSLRTEVFKWTDAEVYNMLEGVRTEDVRTRDGTPLPPDVPTVLTDSANCTRLIDPSATLVEESIILADFGESYAVHGYQPATLINYFAPEAHFEKRAGFEADVWELGCAIFEIRAGRPLFPPFFNSSEAILKHTVATLGRLPDPWWEQFKYRDTWFSDDEKPKPSHEQGGSYPVQGTSIRELLNSIGVNDLKPTSLGTVRPIFEKTGVRLSAIEAKLLGNLLEKMMRYNPEDRIKLHEIIRHPYLAMCG